MFQFLRHYRQLMRNEHGWEVPVLCPVCTAAAVPTFNGWTPSASIGLGNRPTIYANLTCPKCAAPVRSAAQSALVELFSNVAVPESNRRMLKWYVGYAVATSLILLGALAALAVARQRAVPALIAALVVPLALLRPLGQWLNYAVASHRKRCDCGKPSYKFMGMLGRSSCYRCSTCGRLLRLRD